MLEKLHSHFISQTGKEIETNEDLFFYWPPSNYPILISLMLLAITAFTLAIGEQQLAERLAIYAYYFLAIGVFFRFIELVLPEDTLNQTKKRISIFSVYIKQQGSIYIRNTGIMLKNLYSRLKLYLHRAILEMRVRISDFKKHHPPELIRAHIQRHYLKLQNLHIAKPGKNIEVISDISRNIAIFLSVFLVISLIYGRTIDWWFVKSYLYNLVYAILGCFTLYILLRVRF